MLLLLLGQDAAAAEAKKCFHSRHSTFFVYAKVLYPYYNNYYNSSFRYQYREEPQFILLERFFLPGI